MLMPERLVAQAAAKAAGAIIIRSFHNGIAARHKGVADLVTDADVEAERAIVEAIHREYPGHEILAEEAHPGNADAEHLWVVDPIDGTNNFAHKIPHFAVSIAYCRAGRVECGVVFNPLRDDWFVAERGAGASWNGESARVGDFARLDEAIVGVGFPYDRGALMEATLGATGDLIRAGVHGIRRFGTASLDLCMVGMGHFGAYFEYRLSPWDFAAGRLFVEEAGGRVSTCRGDPAPMAGTSLSTLR